MLFCLEQGAVSCSDFNAVLRAGTIVVHKCSFSKTIELRDAERAAYCLSQCSQQHPDHRQGGPETGGGGGGGG